MNRKTRVLLIEDEPGMLLTLTDRLYGEGYEVDTAEDGITGWEMIRGGDYDIVLLDIMLPGKDGLEICRDVRAAGMNMPILMITAKSQVVDKVLGLKIGADDYLVKPFDLMELTARMEALLRRRRLDTAEAVPQEDQGTEFVFGPFVLDYRRKELRKSGRNLGLSYQEYRLLDFFIRNRNTTLSREELLDGVWGYESIPSTRTVDVHVAWLRNKLENDSKNPVYIQTVRKHGYRFVV